MGERHLILLQFRLPSEFSSKPGNTFWHAETNFHFPGPHLSLWLGFRFRLEARGKRSLGLRLDLSSVFDSRSSPQ